MKKLLSLLLALTMLFSMAACTADRPDQEDTTEPEGSVYPIVCDFEIKGISCTLAVEDNRNASVSFSQTMTEKNLETIGVDVDDAKVVRTTTASGTYKERRGAYTLTMKKLTLSMEITGEDAEDAREGMLAWYTTHTDDDSASILEAIGGAEVDVSSQLEGSASIVAFELEGDELEAMTVYEADGETVALTYTFHNNGKVEKESHYRDGKVYKSYVYNRGGELIEQSASNDGTMSTEPEDTAKTVYLLTKQTNITPVSQITTETSYDEAGRLMGYRTTRYYPDMGSTSDIALSYEYADYGIRRIILSAGDESVPMVADYEDGHVTGYFGEYDGEVSGWRFSYNADGQIVTVYLLENESEKEVMTLDYYANGMLRERVIQDSFYQMVTKYNEAGKATEQYALDSSSGTFIYRNLYEYDNLGNQVRQEMYSMGSTEPASIMQMEYDDNGRCIAIEASGNGQSAYSVGTWDAATATMTFAFEIEGMGMASMQHTYDEVGHVISSVMWSDDAVMQQNTYTYTALELPADYTEPNLQDPIYLIFALGGS